MIKCVFACTSNGGIGREGKLPWHPNKIEGDLPRFKALTIGCDLLMGRKTWESLHCTELPGRGEHYVLTENPSRVVETDTVQPVQDYEVKVLLPYYRDNSSRHIAIIGGASVIEKYMHMCDEVHVTIVNRAFICDAHVDLDLISETLSAEFEFVDQKFVDGTPSNPGSSTYIFWKRKV